MNAVAWLIAGGLLVGVGLGVWRWWIERPPCLRKRVIVQLRSDPNLSMAGVLWQARGGWLVLKSVEAWRSDHKTTKMDGDCVIPHAEIQFIQVP